jgi:hypothetical protein
MNLRKLLSPFASGLIAFGAFTATAVIASSTPVGGILGVLVSLVSGYRNRSGISSFLAGVATCLIVWAMLGMVVGGQSAVSSAIILVPLVAVVSIVLAAIAFTVGCFIPMIRRTK